MKIWREGDRVQTFEGDQDCDENDNVRIAAPGSIGIIQRVEAEGYHVMYEPSKVWVIISPEEINDPSKYKVEVTRYEIWTLRHKTSLEETYYPVIVMNGNMPAPESVIEPTRFPGMFEWSGPEAIRIFDGEKKHATFAIFPKCGK